VVLPVGNDILHVDNSFKTTTKGTPQDVDGAWHENFTAARKLYVEIIEQLMQVADVHIMHVPSNHDYVTGYCLSDALYCWFNKAENITFDLDMNHRKYFAYGSNMLGISHGDGAKMEQLPLLMANEAPKLWADTKYRYIYLGHIHHKDVFKFRSGKDYQGVTVEYLRSPSASDRWHSEKGFQHAKQAIEAFIHEKKGGQVARITYNFK
jgi:DNA repair exonuclease SbcCD nuclease subunit